MTFTTNRLVIPDHLAPQDPKHLVRILVPELETWINNQDVTHYRGRTIDGQMVVTFPVMTETKFQEVKALFLLTWT
jgi:hypothetical protein